jgi:hypothetical protein
MSDEVVDRRRQPDGRIEATLGGMSVEVLAAEVAGVTHGIEFSDAPDLEAQLAEIGQQLVTRFQEPVDR